jgi:hypothetical protein
MCLVYGVFDMYVHICIIITESIYRVILCGLSFSGCTKRQPSDLWIRANAVLFYITLWFYIDHTWSNSLLGKRDFVWLHLDLLLMDRRYQYVAGDVFNIMAVKKVTDTFDKCRMHEKQRHHVNLTVTIPAVSLVLALWPIQIILFGKVWQIQDATESPYA